ncbi:hypothetical protein MettiDRAFT_1262 [Methanolobus tindarius DSM 2278]|uniref:Uncharacterized protein n=1 Tax=Methanolobus tindarius DSM 2278 TaxID=1090322 RepID=W9DVW9_METTI|nr:hypothetical protein [Methanolobus tindarius]ETA67827.1 hypothetical protein MettiDRAFT_1262 [Methanolobus tindarius DSM 2278]
MIGMNKITNHLILCFLLCSSLFFSGCIADSTDGYVIESTNNKSAIAIADLDGSGITNISVFNGMSGDSGTIEDRATIGKLISHLDQYSFEKMDDQTDRGGFRYSMDFYDDSGKIAGITIVGEDMVNIDNVYYQVDGTPINIIYVQELIESGIVSDEETVKKTNLHVSSLINNSSDINKISIKNGFSLESSVIENSTKIKDVISYLDEYPLEAPSNDFLLNGYQYFIYFYTVNGDVSRVCIVDNNTVQIDRVLYEVDSQSIDLAEFKKLISSSSSSNSALTPGNDGLNVGISISMEALSIEDLVSQSDIIIAGTVTGAYPSRWNTADGQRPDKSNDELNIGTEDMIYTDIGVHVNKYLKNPLDTGDLQITIDGGTVGNDSIWVEDSPSFEYGEKVLLFLNWKSGRDEMTVTSGYQGKFTMINDTTAVRGDGVSVSITEMYDHWEITEI